MNVQFICIITSYFFLKNSVAVQVLHPDVGTIRLFVCTWFWSIWFSNDSPWQIFICRKDANSARPLEGLQIVDVGCGGGLLCEVSIGLTIPVLRF